MSSTPIAAAATGKPAERLTGLQLDGGWTVEKIVERPTTATGGYFSVCYLVKGGDGRDAFLKALDYSAALSAPNRADALKALTTAYTFERDVTLKCRSMDRVVRALASGQAVVGPDPIDVVDYLIFEMGDGDIRHHLAVSARIDLAWKLRALHHVATGLKQLHAAGIAHQDLKPSNVVVFDERISKVGDLGRASARDLASPFDKLKIQGAKAYAPPELLYASIDPDWTRHRLGCDLYLLGSMAVYLSAGGSLTHLTESFLDPSVSWRVWTGSYTDVLPYVRAAFDRAVSVFESQVDDAARPEVVALVRELCDPDPELRGDKKNKLIGANQYSLERFVTRLDAIAFRAELGLRR